MIQLSNSGTRIQHGPQRRYSNLASRRGYAQHTGKARNGLSRQAQSTADPNAMSLVPQVSIQDERRRIGLFREARLILTQFVGWAVQQASSELGQMIAAHTPDRIMSYYGNGRCLLSSGRAFGTCWHLIIQHV